MKLLDAHGHVDLLKLQQPWEMDTYALISCTTKEECEIVLHSPAYPHHIAYSVGVHPMYAHKTQMLSQLQPYVSKACAIGEIGMDCIWCQTPLSMQRTMFLAQLDLAQRLHLPLVLHTKGCEQEILQHIKEIHLPILIHWYSSLDTLDGYIAKGCYFSIGPDIKTNKAVQHIARTVPLCRLMIETDGAAAYTWATKQAFGDTTHHKMLYALLETIAHIRCMNLNVLISHIVQNTNRFYGYPFLIP